MWSWIKGLFGGRRPKLDFAAERILREEAHWQRLIAEWPYPLRLVPGTEATAAWFEEAAIGVREGFSPILITPQTEKIPKDLKDIPEADIASPEQIAAALAAAERDSRDADGPLDDWCFDREFFAEIRELLPGPPETEPQAQPFGNITSFSLRAPYPQVAITRLPTPESWRVPLLLGLGGWNCCPRAATLAAFARHWKQLYGAELAVVTQDTLEFVVARPPATFADATRLAKEQCLMGNEFNDLDMSEYIAALRTMRLWYFWWD